MNPGDEFYFELKTFLEKYPNLPVNDIIEAVKRINVDYEQRKDQNIKKSKRVTKKYDSEEERKTAYKIQQNNYAKKNWKCDVCDVEMYLGNKSKHLLSKKHLKNEVGNGDCPTCSDSN